MGQVYEIAQEADEQIALFRWARYEEAAWPELRLLHHVANEGKRSRATGARMVAEGLRRGVPDVCLPVPRGGYHGLYIEMKRVKGGRISEDQAAWISMLRDQGYAAVVCRGWEAASEMIKSYLEGKYGQQKDA